MNYLLNLINNYLPMTQLSYLTNIHKQLNIIILNSIENFQDLYNLTKENNEILDICVSDDYWNQRIDNLLPEISYYNKNYLSIKQNDTSSKISTLLKKIIKHEIIKNSYNRTKIKILELSTINYRGFELPYNFKDIDTLELLLPKTSYNIVNSTYIGRIKTSDGFKEIIDEKLRISILENILKYYSINVSDPIFDNLLDRDRIPLSKCLIYITNNIYTIYLDIDNKSTIHSYQYKIEYKDFFNLIFHIDNRLINV